MASRSFLWDSPMAKAFLVSESDDVPLQPPKFKKEFIENYKRQGKKEEEQEEEEEVQ